MLVFAACHLGPHGGELKALTCGKRGGGRGGKHGDITKMCDGSVLLLPVRGVTLEVPASPHVEFFVSFFV